jgi:dTDP-4-amino-4,6-dideoxygalactose transaminase
MPSISTSSGITTLIHYRPPHRTGAYAADQHWLGRPIAQTLGANALSLPLTSHHTVADVDAAADAVGECLHRLT